MRRLFIALLGLIAGSILFMSCAPAGSNGAANAGNKPANSTNSAANAVSSSSTADKAAVEADIKKTLDEFAAALNKNDGASLDKFYTDDYTLVDQAGAVHTKAARVEAVKSGTVKFEGLKFEDLKFKVNPEGTAAVVLGHVTGKNVVNGKSEDRNSMVTWVVVKNKDKGWQFLNAQITDIKPGTAAPAKEDDKKPAANANK